LWDEQVGVKGAERRQMEGKVGEDLAVKVQDRALLEKQLVPYWEAQAG
jgi:hypothetical protein